MNKILLAAFVVGACVVVAEGLNCYSCSVGIWGRCFSSSQQTCSGTDNNCYAGVAAFNITGALNFYTSGCITSANCNSSTGSVLGVGYTITRTCCSNNLCNSAAGVQLSLTAALSAALLASICNYI